MLGGSTPPSILTTSRRRSGEPSKLHGGKLTQVLQQRGFGSSEVIAYAFHLPPVSLNIVFGLRCVLFRWPTTEQRRERT